MSIRHHDANVLPEFRQERKQFFGGETVGVPAQEPRCFGLWDPEPLRCLGHVEPESLDPVMNAHRKHCLRQLFLRRGEPKVMKHIPRPLGEVGLSLFGFAHSEPLPLARCGRRDRRPASARREKPGPPSARARPHSPPNRRRHLTESPRGHREIRSRRGSPHARRARSRSMQAVMSDQVSPPLPNSPGDGNMP